MKLAPINESSGLQPLPASVHANVSQNVNGTTSDALSQTLEEQQPAPQTLQQQQGVAQRIGASIPHVSFSGFSPFWFVLAAFVIIAALVAWLWKSF